jgi:hypothetical protein
MNHIFLVGGFNPPKNMKVSGDYDSQCMEKNKCSKLPTRFKQFIENILNLLLGSAREVTA